MITENNKWPVKYALGLIIAIIIVLVGFSIFSKPKDDSTIKIGVILPLSGDLAMLGEPARQGAEMAMENFTNTKHKYELILEDDRYDVNKTVTAANKLISVDKVSAVITLGSAEGNAVKPLAKTAKIIHFNTAASDQTIPDGKYIFTHWTPPAEEAKTMVAELTRRNVKKIAIFTTNNDGMIAISAELKKQLAGTDIFTVMDEKINVGNRDFRTQILKLKANLPDMIVLQNTPPELEILAKQIKEADIKAPLTSIEVFDTTTSPELFKGDWYVTVSDPTDTFKTSFRNKYSAGPELATGNIYDIISLIITATENIKGRPTAENISAELHKIKNLDGAMGTLSIAENGLVLSKASIKTVK